MDNKEGRGGCGGKRGGGRGQLSALYGQDALDFIGGGRMALGWKVGQIDRY